MNWVFTNAALQRLLYGLLRLKEPALKRHEGSDEHYTLPMRSSICLDVFYEVGWSVDRPEGGDIHVRNVWINCALKEGDSFSKMCLLSYNTFYDMTPETYKELSFGLAHIIRGVSERVAATLADGNVSVRDTRGLREKVETMLQEGSKQAENDVGGSVYALSEDVLQKINEEFTIPFCGKPVDAVAL